MTSFYHVVTGNRYLLRRVLVCVAARERIFSRCIAVKNILRNRVTSRYNEIPEYRGHHSGFVFVNICCMRHRTAGEIRRMRGRAAKGVNAATFTSRCARVLSIIVFFYHGHMWL